MVGPKEFIFKITIIGNGSVGKTSMVRAFTERKFSENYIMTIGSNFSVHLIRKPDENIVVRLQLWDLAGQIHFKFVRPSFYRGAFGCVYVFDLTSRESYDAIDEWQKEFVTYNPDVPSILIGNKVDLNEDRVVSRKEGEILAEKMGVLYFETSAKDGTHIDKCFYDLNELLMDKHIRKP
jgi:small GTP-binding protein